MCHGLQSVSYIKQQVREIAVKRFHRCKRNKRALNKFAKKVPYYKALGEKVSLTVEFCKSTPSFIVSKKVFKKESLFGDCASAKWEEDSECSSIATRDSEEDDNYFCPVPPFKEEDSDSDSDCSSIASSDSEEDNDNIFYSLKTEDV
jgi:hypothetical protein